MSRDARNNRVWANYDNWRCSPPEENYLEVFESEKYLDKTWYSCDEDSIIEFDEKAALCKDNWLGVYDSYDESILDIADELCLSDTENCAIIAASELYQDRKQAAEEEKADRAYEEMKDRKAWGDD